MGCCACPCYVWCILITLYLLFAICLDSKALLLLILLGFAISCLCCRLCFYPCLRPAREERLYDGRGIDRANVQSPKDASLQSARRQAQASLAQRLRDGAALGAKWRDTMVHTAGITLRATTQGAGGEKAVVWLRSDQFMDRPTLFGAGPEPDDVGQGRLGDCYLLAAMAALAERPDRIRSLFANDAENDRGMYGVLLSKHGQWHTMWVDDVFPVELDRLRGDKYRPCFCNSKDTNKLWPLLLEKAWAMLYGDGKYENIEGGIPVYPLHALTMCPTLRYDGRDYSEDEMWEVLQSADQSGSVISASCATKPLCGLFVPPCCRWSGRLCRNIFMCCGWCETLFLLWETALECLNVLLRCLCAPLKCILALPIFCCCCIPCCIVGGGPGLLWLLNSLWGEAGLSGIVAGHGYSVLGVMEVPTAYCTTARLVKLRNPWGQTEWTGLFSEGSFAWTDEALDMVGESGDGVFWMHLSDFMSYLGIIGICYVAPGRYNTLDKRPDGEVACWPLVDDEDELAPEPLLPLATGWHVTSCPFSVPEGTMEGGVAIVVREPCQAFVTVNDSEKLESEGTRGYLCDSESHWAVMVFDEEQSLVAKNLAPPRVLLMGCCDSISALDRQFSNLTSLSTTQMQLQPGRYVVEAVWPDPVERDVAARLLIHSTCPVSLEPVPDKFLPDSEDDWEEP